MTRSKIDDISSSRISITGVARCWARSQSAPLIASTGPRFDQANIAMKCAAKNAMTRNGVMVARPSVIILTTSRCEVTVPTAAP